MTELQYSKDRLEELKALHREAPTGLDQVLELMRKEQDLIIDIIPGYKIKEKEFTAGVQSAETIELNNIEQNILVRYRKYLDHLLKCCKARVEAVSDQAYMSLCKLLGVACYFNYSSSLIKAVVEGCNARSQPVADACVDALCELFDTDGTGEATLKAISCMTNLIKAKRHTINPQILNSFIHLRFTAIDSHRKSAHDKDEEANRTKKKNSIDHKIDKELNWSSAVVSRADQQKTQTAILQRLVAAYLRVIETAQSCNGVRQSRLLGPTMEGLTKFALLLDIELLQLLITAIKDLLEAPNVTAMTTLNAVITLSTLTHAAEQATTKITANDEVAVVPGLSVDMGYAYSHLYRIIPEVLSVPTAADLMSVSRERASALKDMRKRAEGMGSGGSTATGVGGGGGGAMSDAMSVATSMATTINLQHEYINLSAERNRRVTLLLRALNVLLLKSGQVSYARLSAFAKRLATYAIHQPPHVAMALMSFVRSMAQKRPAVAEMLAQTPALMAGPGKYNPDAETPDHAGAQSCILWEWCLMTKSYHPTTRTFTNVVQKTALQLEDPTQKRQQGLTEAMQITVNRQLVSAAEDVLKMHDTSLGAFNPAPIEPPSRKRKELASDDPDDLLEGHDDLSKVLFAKKRATGLGIKEFQKRAKPVIMDTTRFFGGPPDAMIPVAERKI